MGQLYDTTKKLSEKYSKLETPFKDKEGMTITEIHERRNRWVEHIDQLLNRPVPLNSSDIEVAHTNVPVNVTLPTIEEISMTIRQVESAKAAEPDNIPAEAHKSEIEVTANIPHILFRKIWEEEQVPQTDWKK
ncbi:hypothetical protein MS3_00000931 [Schistosoma haematobium]|uniref:Uncharacterized protein n=1 Tax=Schistosoma haematobium TaxID=6185 RepID=A0A922S7F1_SCHHA|nr:hypothetical protein MS3_00000931 [Schistosoma haematobium]KAH9596569.1 hypothetical protein MS3_00000931 [Schistosoma haematobium]